MILRSSERRAQGAGALRAAIAVLVALGLAACGPAPAGTEPAASATPGITATASAPPAAASPPTASEAPSEAPQPAPTPTPGEMIPPPGAASAAASDGPLEAAPLPTTAAQLGEVVSFDTGVVVEIDAVEATEVSAETPGETSGTALVVRVTARNDSAQPQSVDSAVVTVVADDGELGIGTTAGAPSPLAGVIEPGDSASGTYVFMLDPAPGRGVTVSVNYAAGEPVAVFTGEIS